MSRSVPDDGFTIRVPHVTVFGGSDGALRLNSGLGGPQPGSPDDDPLAGLRAS